MKQMTKEELIEYFIEQLGDNEILGQIMSIEQIRDKLNYIVKDVTYHEEPGNFAGGWVIDKNGTGTVNFDIRKIPLREEKAIIVHELLHALSTSSKTQKVGKYYTAKLEKCGIHFSKKSYRNDNYKIAYDESNNVAINEGMTDTLAEIITGVNHDGYNTEKDIYKIIAIIVGEDTMLREYFSESISDENSIFQRGLVEKYGDILGEDINTDLIKVLYLSDLLLNLNRNNVIHGLNENGKAIQGKTRDEIGNTLGNMIERIIDNEKDFTKKFEILTKLKNAEYIISFNIIRRISKKIQNELINSTDIDYTKKLEMIRIFKRHFEKDSIEEILFNLPEAKQLTPEERLQNGMYLLNGKATIDYADILYRLYVENGKINEEHFSKKMIFWDVLIGSVDRIEDIESIDAILGRTIYRKMGRLIIISDNENEDMHYISSFSNVFNENGQMLNFRSIRICNSGMFNIDSITEQLKDRFEQYKKSAKKEYSYDGTEIAKDPDTDEYILISKYNTEEGKISEVFKVGSDGHLETITGSTEWRRLTDDMSELDIKLQQETAGVSITEMMQEADSIKIALEDKTPKINENSRGEDENGK